MSSWQEVPAILGALATLLLGVGGGLKWLINRVDSQQAASNQAQSDARQELSDRLHDEIRLLRAELVQTKQTHAAELNLYRRRIYQLEHFIHEQPGINIPVSDWWPPK